MADAVKWFFGTAFGGALIGAAAWLAKQWLKEKKEWFELVVRDPIKENSRGISNVASDLVAVRNSVAILSQTQSAAFINLTEFVHRSFEANHSPIPADLIERLKHIEDMIQANKSIAEAVGAVIRDQDNRFMEYEKQANKFITLASALNNRNKLITTEIEQLKKDLFIVRGQKK